MGCGASSEGGGGGEGKGLYESFAPRPALKFEPTTLTEVDKVFDSFHAPNNKIEECTAVIYAQLGSFKGLIDNPKIEGTAFVFDVSECKDVEGVFSTVLPELKKYWNFSFDKEEKKLNRELKEDADPAATEEQKVSGEAFMVKLEGLLQAIEATGKEQGPKIVEDLKPLLLELKTIPTKVKDEAKAAGKGMGEIMTAVKLAGANVKVGGSVGKAAGAMVAATAKLGLLIAKEMK